MSQARNQIRAALETYFVGVWAARTPLQLPNVRLSPPQNEPWARLTLLFSSSFQQTLSVPGSAAAGSRHEGVISLQLFFPAGRGAGDALALGDAAAVLLLKKRIAMPAAGPYSGCVVETLVPSVLPIGNAEPALYQVNVEVSFGFSEDI